MTAIRICLAVVFGCLLAGCVQDPGKNGPTPEPKQPVADARTVEGVLRYYPSDVKSVEAWAGHNFMVGDTPILPSDAVTEETLRQHVDKTVVVTGTWDPGQPWQPTAVEQAPADALPGVTVRGDGLRASSIAEAK